MLYCANCVDFMANMEADSVDMTLTSPPYDDLRTYNGYTFDFEAIAKGYIVSQSKAGLWFGLLGIRQETGTKAERLLGKRCISRKSGLSV